MRGSKRKRNIIIFSLVLILFCMVVGYSAFQTKLEIKGTSKVTSNWDIEITNVTECTPSGFAENTVAPFWDKTTANMEATLFASGDAMEYDVTIENKGTLDAKLNDILTNLENNNSEAVLITFSGYTKGEVLKAKTSKVVHVKIEYNPDYEGGETSSEVEINFDYVQNNNEENNPDNQYLLTYDYKTNGGTNIELKEEYLTADSNVDLTNTATKEGWTFVGWNTNKDAEVGLESYQMPNSNTTLYAIYSKTLKVAYQKGENIESIGKVEDSCNIYNNNKSCEITLPNINVNSNYIVDGWYNGNNKVGSPNDKYSITADTTLTSKSILDTVSVTISTTSTTNSITVVASAQATSGIAKYEYSIDGGKTWIASTSNTYTFTGLTQGTNYNIMVRVTSNTGKVSTTNKTVTTSSLAKPTFVSNNNGEVTINYPSGCTNGKTCSYSKNNGSYINVSGTSGIYFGSDGNVVAKVTDGVNTVTSTYTVIRNDLYISSSGSDSTGYGTLTKPYATLAKAYSSATTTTSSTINVMSNITQTTTATSSTINVMSNITQTTTATFSQGKTVTIKGYGAVRTITQGSGSISLIYLTSGNITVSNLTINGNNLVNTSSNSGITVTNGAVLNLNSGTTITKLYHHYQGGALTISGGATLNINGATITNNYSNFQGGAIQLNGATLNLNSGSISNNQSNKDGASNQGEADGGALYVHSGSILNMKGGTISGNKGRNGFAIILSNSTMTMTNGSITNNSGQAGAVNVYNKSKFTMSGGSITNNTASWQGGGVARDSGSTFTQTGGTISGNKPNNTYVL